MNLPDGVLPGYWPGFGIALAAVLLLLALWRAPWYHLKDSSAGNVWLAACVVVMLMWNIRAGIVSGLGFHLLGMTVMTLMFDWQFALIGAALLLVGVTLNDAAGWSGYGWNLVTMAGMPVLVTTLMRRFSERRLPPNFFVYVFFIAFLGGVVSMAAVGASTTLLYYLSGAHSWKVLSHNYLPIYLLLLFPEGFMSGMLMSIIVVYRPQWVSTFDDGFYLRGR